MEEDVDDVDADGTPHAHTPRTASHGAAAAAPEGGGGGGGGVEDGDEEEPRLKYQRLMVRPLRDDKASCLQVHFRFLVLGTEAGHIYVLDVNGNVSRHYKDHADAVTDIAVDVQGDYIGSCSRDGKVVVRHMFGEESFEYAAKQPIQALAIDPNYKRARRFVCGGKSGALVMVQKSAGLIDLFRPKEAVLFQARDTGRGRDAVTAIAWRGPLIAWSSTTCVHVYDVETNTNHTVYERSQVTPRYRCYLCWLGDDTLMFAWFDLVTIITVRPRPRSDRLMVPPTAAVPKVVEPVARFQTDFMICGAAPYGEMLLLLSYIAETDPRTGKLVPCQPELQFMKRTGEELTSEILPIHRCEVNYPIDYSLVSIGDTETDVLFYIVSPTDVVQARPRDVDDHVSWLLREEAPDYAQALAVARENEGSLRTHNITDIGESYLGFLLGTGRFAEAARLTPEVLRHDKGLWEKWVFRFDEVGKHDVLAPFIPTKNPVLEPFIYEVALNAFLRFNPDLLLETVRRWPSDIYKVPAVIAAVEAKIAESGSEDRLLETLAVLYTYTKQYDKTLLIYLKLRRREAFELITKYNLFKSVENKVELLLLNNENEALKLLVNNTNQIPVKHVVAQLRDAEPLLHRYLHELFQKSQTIASDFHSLQVELYAKYDPPLLLKFLQQATAIDLDRAKDFCESHQLWPELAFILGRMGNMREALRIIMDKQRDIERAIEFVRSQDDKDLWMVLIDHSMSNPEFISGLLQHMGATEHVEPIELIRQIPDGTDIPHLRDHLVKILSDYNLQMSLREGCNAILKSDVVSLMHRMYVSQRRAVRVDQVHVCASCNGRVIGCANDTGLVVFYCGHFYHQRCLQSGVDGGGGGALSASAAVTAAAAAAAATGGRGGVPRASKFDELPALSASAEGASVPGGAAFRCLLCHTAAPRRAHGVPV